jgi:hypothetical protein
MDHNINMKDVYVQDWVTSRLVKFFKDYEMRDFDDFEVPTQEWETLWKGIDAPFLWRMQFRYKWIEE